MNQTIVVAGCGYVGSELLRQIAERGRGERLIGIRRSNTPLPFGEAVAADLSERAELRNRLPVRQVDALVYAASPDGRSDEAYEKAYVSGFDNALAVCRPKRVVLVGSTGVVERNDGSWIDERTPLTAEGFVARHLLRAEALAHAAGGCVLRLGGIYGPGRRRLIESVRSGTATIPEETVYTNRIHRDDAAGMIVHLLDLPRIDPVYFGCDLEAAPYADVLRFLAEKLGVPEPAVGPSDRRSNKRIDSSRIVRSGYRFRYPTYREGYAAMLAR